VAIGIAQVNAFLAIAERGNFTRAAGHLGMSRPALSETIRAMESDLGVRLFNRTTRSVSLTQAGERFLAAIRPALDGFQAALESVSDYRGQAAGVIRLTVPRPALRTIIAPVLAQFMRDHPAVSLEVIADSALADIVRERFDAGIRPGHRLEKDMVAVRVGEDARPIVVAAPEYLRRHPPPIKTPGDLRQHNCVRQRYASGSLHRWVFERRGKSVEVAVSGTLITSDGELALRAALDGVAIARVPTDAAQPFLSKRGLVALLQDWQPASVGFYLYYPSHRQVPAGAACFHRGTEGRSRQRRRATAVVRAGQGRYRRQVDAMDCFSVTRDRPASRPAARHRHPGSRQPQPCACRRARRRTMNEASLCSLNGVKCEERALALCILTF